MEDRLRSYLERSAEEVEPESRPRGRLVMRARARIIRNFAMVLGFVAVLTWGVFFVIPAFPIHGSRAVSGSAPRIAPQVDLLTMLTAPVSVDAIDVSSGQVTHLLSLPVDAAEHLAWSPDGNKLAFGGASGGNFDIYLVNADGTGVQRLTTSPGVDSYPSWSPDGSRIAFTSDRDDPNAGQVGAITKSEIYVMNANGSDQVNLTNNPADDAAPAWSPDGGLVAFASNRAGSYDTWTSTPNGGTQHQLTTLAGNETTPAWSPDGVWIAFESTQKGNTEIYRMNSDGANIIDLTNDSSEDGSPSWSHDGLHIAFETDRNDVSAISSGSNYEIYLMGPDGSLPTRLTFDSVWNGDAAWRRLAGG